MVGDEVDADPLATDGAAEGDGAPRSDVDEEPDGPLAGGGSGRLRGGSLSDGVLTVGVAMLGVVS